MNRLPLLLLLSLPACAGQTGPAGLDGADGAAGADGADGQNGSNGSNGQDGNDGQDGDDGQDGQDGENGADAPVPNPILDPDTPLSSVIAIRLVDPGDTDAENLADYVKALVEAYAEGTIDPDLQFPLATASTDSVRGIAGTASNVVVSWLTPLTWDDDATAPHFGANADYLAWFGDGWDDVATNTPQWNGSGSEGWLWVNHEYVSNSLPTASSAPTGQYLTLARWLRHQGVLGNDVEASSWAQTDIDTLISWSKKQVGGSWMRVVQDPASGEWMVDRNSDNLRYDATDSTLSTVTGLTVGLDHDDSGVNLPAGVGVGILANCSGGQTPWGTVLTGEENAHGYYGDLDACWDSNQMFLAGTGCDPGTAITLDVSASASGEFGQHSDTATRHEKDQYGYVVEIDPGEAAGEYEGLTTEGVGHRRIGALGRARWENATLVVGADWALQDGQPIVLYAGDDRRSGRIYKFVTTDSYHDGMSRAEIRALLDEGSTWVSHFEGLDVTTGYTLVDSGEVPDETTPGTGRWVKLSLDSTDLAPNGEGLGDATRTVGDALADDSWNDMGGYRTDDDVLKTLFTASAKVGASELNRPEDLEWNPLDLSGTPRLYVAFTNDNKRTQTDQDGVLRDPATHSSSTSRADSDGRVFAIQEDDPTDPSTSSGFTYFQVWGGAHDDGEFDAACPDNLMVDDGGGLWFGTDGNFGRNGFADGIYYLDLDPDHTEDNTSLAEATYGRAFRVLGVPSDAEATGPAFSTNLDTLFLSVQHPGEEQYSGWPAR